MPNLNLSTPDEILTELQVLKGFMNKLKDDPYNKDEYLEIENQYYELLNILERTKNEEIENYKSNN